MMNWSDGNFRAVELHLHELRAQAARNRLAHQIHRARPRRWRHRLGAVLIAAGEALAGPALNLTCHPTGVPPQRGRT